MKIELKWAFLSAFAIFLLLTIEYFLGLQTKEKMGTFTIVDMIFGFLIPMVAIASGITEKRDRVLNGVVNYGGAVKIGIFIAIFSIPFYLLFNYIFHTFINPNYFADVIAYSVDTGKMTQGLAEATFNLPSYITQIAIATPIAGIILSLIISIFIKKDNAV